MATEQSRRDTGAIRIGIDGRPLLGARTGIGRYVADLCEELDHQLPEARFFTYVPRLEDISLPSARWHLRAPERLPPKAGGYFWFKFMSRDLVARDRLDWFMATRTLLPRLHGGVRSVSIVYDLNHVVTPASMTLLNRIAHMRYFRGDVLAATKVAAISHGTARRLEEYCGRRCQAIVRPQTSPHFRPAGDATIARVRAQFGLPDRYLLSVATLEPRKNIDSLLEAFERLRARGGLDGYVLALAGGEGWKTGPLARRIAEAAPQVVRLGYVDDEALPALYSGAAAFILPSLYEGFGMPVAEAAACGTPVVCTDIPELREASGGAATHVAPDPDSIAAGILRVLGVPRPLPVRVSEVPDLRALFDLT